MTKIAEGVYSKTIEIDPSVEKIEFRATATDNKSNVRESGMVATFFHEADLPEIESIKFDPKKPKSGEEVIITVKVSDATGIDKVILSYDIGDGWVNSSIYTNDLEEYVFTLSIPEEETTFSYQLFVYDTWGNCLVTDIAMVDLNVGPLPISPLMTLLAIGLLALAYLVIRKRV
jgi:hypothetical protein